MESLTWIRMRGPIQSHESLNVESISQVQRTREMAWPCDRDPTAIGGFGDSGRKSLMEECSHPLEARKGKEIDFPLKPPERNIFANSWDTAL